MRIFAVRDDYIYKESASCENAQNENGVHKDLAYLFYYEKEKLFFTELPEDADPWEMPLLEDYALS